jgi:hypothetical protein
MTDKIKTKSCRFCRFSREHALDDEVLLCQRHAPKPVLTQVDTERDDKDEPEFYVNFARVDASDWCGEFELDWKR